MIKKFGKNFLCWLLERQVMRLRERHNFQVIAVAGSMGKTSTKLAIASVLSSKTAVRYQGGNYNDRLTVPLIFFGQDEPGIFNVPAWLKILLSNERQLRQDYPYEYVVVELGTDAPGQMQAFAYLQPEIGVLTAVAPEHMEFFGTLDKVAVEELQIALYSKKLLVNQDDVPAQYLASQEYVGYSVDQAAPYTMSNLKTESTGTAANLQLRQQALAVQLPLLGKQGAKITLAAAAVADQLGFTAEEITAALHDIPPIAGRMQILKGIKGSTLIDDTYNASPPAVKAALDVLESLEAAQHIAILGSMNELGGYSPEAHQEVGAYCSGRRLDVVVTVGREAQQYLAPAAKEAGCEVVSFISPYEAGAYVKEHLQPHAVVLAKGSQNGVFAEEALKALLAQPADVQKLVRQSHYWLERKRKQFPTA